MTYYWATPPRKHIINYFVQQLGWDRVKLELMKLKQLRAIWHKQMTKIHGEET